MRHSKTLQKLRDGEAVRICSLGHFIPAYIRHAAHNDFDCIWLDLEHRAMSVRDVQALLAFFHLFDIDCMLRPPTREKTQLYRFLEDGATGLMIPQVSTAEAAHSLVEAVKFPPLGARGIDGAGLDSDFYVNPDADYPQLANRETFLVVQIETPQAVANVDEIAAVEGVDGLFIGPGDLELRLRADGHSGMTLEQAAQEVAAAARKHGKAWGAPAGDLARLRQLHLQGARLIAHGGEFAAFMTMLAQSAENFDQVCGRR